MHNTYSCHRQATADDGQTTHHRLDELCCVMERSAKTYILATPTFALNNIQKKIEGLLIANESK